jgi:hypothetical protein
LRDDGWEGRLLGVDYSEASVALAVKVGAARRKREDEDGEDEELDVVDEESDKKAHLMTTGSGDPHSHPITAPAPGSKTVDFMVWDVLAGPISAVSVDPPSSSSFDSSVAGWDVVLDKGTFDAVSLSDQKDKSGRRICESYRGRVLRLLRTGGVFLVTSCNWTEDELKGWFEGGEEGVEGQLRQVDRVEYRSFSFGGVKGQTISTACFLKV